MLLQMGLLLRNKLTSKMQAVTMEAQLEEYCQKLHCFNISHFNKRQIQISLFQCLILAAFNIKINKLFVGSIAQEVIKHELHNTKKILLSTLENILE